MREGYDRWAATYDEDGHPLIGLEDRHLPALSEHAVDAAFASTYPRAERYVGWPMLFLLRATPA